MSVPDRRLDRQVAEVGLAEPRQVLLRHGELDVSLRNEPMERFRRNAVHLHHLDVTGDGVRQLHQVSRVRRALSHMHVAAGELCGVGDQASPECRALRRWGAATPSQQGVHRFWNVRVRKRSTALDQHRLRTVEGTGERDLLPHLGCGDQPRRHHVSVTAVQHVEQPLPLPNHDGAEHQLPVPGEGAEQLVLEAESFSAIQKVAGGVVGGEHHQGVAHLDLLQVPDDGIFRRG